MRWTPGAAHVLILRHWSTCAGSPVELNRLCCQRGRRAAQGQSGEWPPGTKLPSRAQLCKEYGVSDTVVGKAMMILRATGLTETLEGVGVFVADKQ